MFSFAFDAAEQARDVVPVADIFYQALHVPVAPGVTVHVQRIHGPLPGPPVLLLHGSLGNGRVFYAKSGKGLAPFLARQGFDTYSVDLRGRGGSRPKVSRRADYGQTEALLEDLPAACAAVKQMNGAYPRFWVAHSWGGAMLMSFLARFPALRSHLAAAVFFGSKRVIRRDSLGKKLILNLGFDTLGSLLARVVGYLHGRHLGFGDDAESKKFYRQTRSWLRGAPWIDSDDGYDYLQRLQAISPLPVLHFTGVRDRVMAEAGDIRRFMVEYGGRDSELRVLSRDAGNHKDYGHIDILTEPAAVDDHFPQVVAWFKRWDQGGNHR
ncbi:alpha/beta fold hydrolase [Acanthopleuribacter pedis]|uniref:Alpha/beta fold hydrolase n=1 Tax=Acanthopleuribacter pedis TaxID=442870 RepID=A0A8J7QEW7_9BACT|nr:alpha/beta fold hydrolase [Acanthopleuribacter pedis]MBO1317573.1 alpha/beta fold hydrolase [Acanthopleuribacter pedis]